MTISTNEIDENWHALTPDDLHRHLSTRLCGLLLFTPDNDVSEYLTLHSTLRFGKTRITLTSDTDEISVDICLSNAILDIKEKNCLLEYIPTSEAHQKRKIESETIVSGEKSNTDSGSTYAVTGKFALEPAASLLARRNRSRLTEVQRLKVESVTHPSNNWSHSPVGEIHLFSNEGPLNGEVLHQQPLLILRKSAGARAYGVLASVQCKKDDLIFSNAEFNQNSFRDAAFRAYYSQGSRRYRERCFLALVSHLTTVGLPTSDPGTVSIAQVGMIAHPIENDVENRNNRKTKTIRFFPEQIDPLLNAKPGLEREALIKLGVDTDAIPSEESILPDLQPRNHFFTPAGDPNACDMLLKSGANVRRLAGKLRTVGSLSDLFHLGITDSVGAPDEEIMLSEDAKNLIEPISIPLPDYAHTALSAESILIATAFLRTTTFKILWDSLDDQHIRMHTHHQNTDTERLLAIKIAEIIAKKAARRWNAQSTLEKHGSKLHNYLKYTIKTAVQSISVSGTPSDLRQIGLTARSVSKIKQ